MLIEKTLRNSVMAFAAIPVLTVLLSTLFHTYTNVYCGLILTSLAWHCVGEVLSHAKVEPVYNHALVCRGSRVAQTRRKIYVAVFSGSACQNDSPCC
jgi:E3 ubiquitin-protein ligase DOA10